VPPGPEPACAFLILASRSPRRAGLLREAGYAFTAVDPPFNDPPQPACAEAGVTQDPEALAAGLAVAKARSAAGDAEVLRAAARGAAVVLGADTVVVAADAALLGQPADRDDARRMLTALIGRTHRVVTAVALLRLAAPPGARAEDLITLVDSAEVRIGPVGEAELSAYLAGGDWRGKAGAYNLAQLQAHWPFEVAGDPGTVVGLPMRKLRAPLRDLGINPESVPSPRRHPCVRP
jgi:septum formation protein